MKDLNVRSQTITMPNALGHWNGQGFFGQDCKRTGNKDKNRQLELYQ